METTALSIGKSVLNGAVGYAKSAIADEVALQLGVQRDQAFIRDELEMMQSFLMAADEERCEQKVVKTWVKQVRDVAYDVEDCLEDSAVRLGNPSWWHFPRTLLVRRRVAKQLKELRAKVEDVSQRNVRYRLIDGPSANVEKAADKASMVGEATSFGIEEAMWQKDKVKVNLIELITRKDEHLRVIALWGTSTVLAETTVIRRTFDDPRIQKKYQCRAFIKLMHPFSSVELLKGIMRQFHIDSLRSVGEIQDKVTLGAQVLHRMRNMELDDLSEEFKRYVNDKIYLIVLIDVSIEDWDQIKTYFPNTKNGSRIIVCTEHVEDAGLMCIGQESGVTEHIQLSFDQTLYAFCVKGSENGIDITEAGATSNAATTSSNNSADRSLTRKQTMLAGFKESHLIGRANEKGDIIKLILNEDSQHLEVISVYGMGGLGKTTLVKDIYQSQEVSGMFQKRACLTVTRPFNLEEILSAIAMQLDTEGSGNKEKSGLVCNKTKWGVQQSLAGLLEGKKYLIVLDDLSTTNEWDTILRHFPTTETASRILVTTRVEKIAMHCSKKSNNIYKLKALGYKDACDLFTEKVFGEITDLDKHYPELVEEAKLILRKCRGLPLAIVAIGGYLANQPTTSMEWRKLNEHISAELEMNPKIGVIKAVLLKSYDGLPYHLKSCFLYLSIFPEDHSISRRRLVRRWAAEGYSTEVRGISAEETADSYFLELIDRSMTIPFKESFGSTKEIDSCQVHDLIREISISKSMEENLVFRLEDGCICNNQGTMRHLVVSSNWEGDQSAFESTVDLSRIRSLTVFGKWRPFFITSKMRLLRVLDLEGTSCLADHHLEQIGKFLHLKYLSLRGSSAVHYLPDSFGDLRQLQTLDIRETKIMLLPKTIIKLQKLKHLHAGRKLTRVSEESILYKCQNILFMSLIFCASCCTPKNSQIYGMEGIDTINRRDICTAVCCGVVPSIAMGVCGGSVMMPQGARKMKSLQTLRVVRLAWGNAVVKEIERLTHLRKLGVVGINKKNGQDFCAAVSNLRRLESLSVQSDREPGLQDCLDGMSSPPGNLQSLKLCGILIKLPEWVGKLQNLVKLKLQGSRLMDHASAVQVLGNLPNLIILRLRWDSFKGELHFEKGVFQSLMVLELSETWGIEPVIFDDGAAPKLELLHIRYYSARNVIVFSGLDLLPSIKEVRLNVQFTPYWRVADEENRAANEAKFKEDLGVQLARNPRQPILKVE